MSISALRNQSSLDKLLAQVQKDETPTTDKKSYVDERLWKPQFKQVLNFHDWVNDLPSTSQIGFATTRLHNLQDCEDWLKERPNNIQQVWLIIGPEGGWNKDEVELAFESGFDGVSMGINILRTSTAAVSACQLMASWRRIKSSLID